MPVAEETRRALDVKTLGLPPDVAVVGLEAEEYTDSTGEASLRIWVMLDEATEVEKLSGESIGELKAAIRESLRQHGITFFPYIFLVKPSERADGDEE